MYRALGQRPAVYLKQISPVEVVLGIQAMQAIQAMPGKAERGSQGANPYVIVGMERAITYLL
jgi:hypothetical protein